jgi:hypothetical protein
LAVERLLVVALVALFLVGAYVVLVPTTGNPKSSPSNAQIVPANEIVSGGPPPDGIPSIDHPIFVKADNTSFLSDQGDWVIGLYYRGEAKAYPLQIMVWHEIVNDLVGGTTVAVTYCPLCYSVAAYVRTINGKEVTFGTSGSLYNNNLVMYDRASHSLWSQIWGKAIAGNLSGYVLQRIPVDVLPWGEWKALYPDTMVLSRQTGHPRPYGDDPYGGYYYSDQVLFPLTHRDDRMPVKTVVWGFSFNGSAKAYPLKSLQQTAFADVIGGESVLVWRLGNDVRLFSPNINGVRLTFTPRGGSLIDEQAHSTWSYDGTAISGPLKGSSLARYSPETAFWFAWAAFYPDTSLYSG